MLTKQTNLITGLAAVTLLFAVNSAYAGCGACATSHDHAHAHAHEHGKNIVETAAEAGKFNTLLAAATTAGLADTLTGEGPYTVFAPTDAAFAKLPDGTVESLLQPENHDKLRQILLYHVVPGKIPASQVIESGLLKTATKGKFLTVSLDDNGAYVDNATIVKADIKASNGVIHVIDTVVIPHDKPNIVSVASQAGQFNTLLAAAKAAGLADTLMNNGPYTVFAPTDAAFAKLPDGTVESLLRPENKSKLQKILLYHVSPGVHKAEKVVAQKHIATATGINASVMIMGKQPYIDSAKIIKTDIAAANGVIHVIDTVMIPDESHATAQ